MDRKSFAITLAACLLAGSLAVIPVGSSSNVALAAGQDSVPVTGDGNIELFSDSNGHWAKPAIDSLAMLGIVNGADGRVRPNDPISRAEFVKILLVATDTSLDSQTNMPFIDVPKHHWAYQIIATAATRGIVNGIDGQHFAPDAPVTREQLAKLLTTNSQSLSREATGMPTFSDVNGGWSYSYIVDAYQTGLIKGLEGNRFAPTNNATRAEAFIMIERMLHKETKTVNLPSDETLLGRVNTVVQTLQQSTGIPAGFSNQFTGPWQSVMQKTESGQISLPDAGLPAKGYTWLSSHVMQRAEHYSIIKVISTKNASTGDPEYEFLEVHLIKRDGQWKIGYFVSVGGENS